MGKHSLPADHAHARTAVMGTAIAVAAIWLAVASAGTAEAKTHHGADAPGNPFGQSQAHTSVVGTEPIGSSFSTVRISRSAQGVTIDVGRPAAKNGAEVVSSVGNTPIRSSGGALSGTATGTSFAGNRPESTSGGQSGQHSVIGNSATPATSGARGLVGSNSAGDSGASPTGRSQGRPHR